MKKAQENGMKLDEILFRFELRTNEIVWLCLIFNFGNLSFNFFLVLSFVFFRLNDFYQIVY